MHNLRYILYSVLSCLCFACTSEELEMGRTSGFSLKLSDDVTVTTRMTPAELGAPVAKQFNVKVLNQSTGRAVYDGQFTDFVNADAGDYTITATYGENVVLEVNAPYYNGTAEASITKAHPTPSVTIPCHVANSLLSVRYLDREGNVSTANFDECFSSYSISLTIDGVSTELQSVEQSAYFRAGTMPKLALVGTLADNGRQVAYDIPTTSLPATLNAAEHIILNLSLQESAAGVIIDVAKADVQHVTVEETIPLEWLPAPKVSAFNGQNHLYHIETTQPVDYAAINFSTSHELQDIELTFDFADAAVANLNGTFILSELNSEQAQRLADYGIVLPEVGRTYSDGKVNLHDVVAPLLTDNGEQVDNYVTIRIKANNRWTEQKFTISAVRPVFNMAEQLPGYAWAHSLYVTPLTIANVVDAKGTDPQAIINNAVYEISTDGGATWAEITTKADGYSYIQGLAPETDYLLRARVGSVITSATTVVATTEAEVGVPNGDFEELQQTLDVSKLNAGGDYAVNVGFIRANYQNNATFTVQEPTGWASVNDKTCNVDLCANKYTWYATPSTYATTIHWAQFCDFRKNTSNNPTPYKNLAAHNGENAMVLRNVGWDHHGSTVARSGGNMNTTYYNTNVPTVSQRSAGKLFLGSYVYNGGIEEYNEGVGYSTRPTNLNGYYHYMQDGDNSEYGTVTVALLHGDEVIATGSGNLTTQSEYTAFRVPLTYNAVLLPATSLRIMFTSSRHASYVQSEETAAVQTSTYNGEYESCMRGATLTVDNLTFTYDK